MSLSSRTLSLILTYLENLEIRRKSNNTVFWEEKAKGELFANSEKGTFNFFKTKRLEGQNHRKNIAATFKRDKILRSGGPKRIWSLFSLKSTDLERVKGLGRYSCCIF